MVATWTDITDAVLEPDKPARSIDALALRDNPIHLAENFIGAVIWFAANAPPIRTLECDGAVISRTTFSDLFDVIGTVFGVGDGSTTFGIPDLRGEFVRGWDNGRGIDSSRAFGSAQSQAFLAHNHPVNRQSSSSSNFGGSSSQGLNVNDGTFNTGNSGGAETRPRNIALLPCIVYKGTGE